MRCTRFYQKIFSLRFVRLFALSINLILIPKALFKYSPKFRNLFIKSEKQALSTLNYAESKIYDFEEALKEINKYNNEHFVSGSDSHEEYQYLNDETKKIHYTISKGGESIDIAHDLDYHDSGFEVQRNGYNDHYNSMDKKQNAVFTCTQLHLEDRHDLTVNYDKMTDYYQKHYVNTGRNQNSDFEKEDKYKATHSTKKLEVYVIPFTSLPALKDLSIDHTANTRSRRVIQSVLTHLINDPESKITVMGNHFWEDFMNNKGSYFEKQMTKNMTEAGRLEVVGNGLTSSDFSVTRFESLIHQMAMGMESEGFFMHRTRRNIRLRDKIAFSYNQKGITPTVAHLFRKLAYKGHVIKNMNYKTKAFLTDKKLYEFFQFHVHTVLAPDDIDCRFDFLKLPQFKDRYGHCSDRNFGNSNNNHDYLDERGLITEGIDSNIAKYANLLATGILSYAKKLRSSNKIILPIGGDYYFQSPEEIQTQISNWRKLIGYFDNHREYKISLKLTTMKEFFDMPIPMLSDKALIHPNVTIGGTFLPYRVYLYV